METFNRTRTRISRGCLYQQVTNQCAMGSFNGTHGIRCSFCGRDNCNSSSFLKVSGFLIPICGILLVFYKLF